MKKLFNYLCFVSLIIVIFTSNLNFAQLILIANDNVITEGNIYKNEKGELFTDAIVVNFNENVIETLKGEQYVTRNNINEKFSKV